MSTKEKGILKARRKPATQPGTYNCDDCGHHFYINDLRILPSKGEGDATRLCLDCWDKVAPKKENIEQEIKSDEELTRMNLIERLVGLADTCKDKPIEQVKEFIQTLEILSVGFWDI